MMLLRSRILIQLSEADQKKYHEDDFM